MSQLYQLNKSEIIYEDDVILVVNKASGLPSQQTLDPNRDHLLAAVSRYLGEDSYVALHHRLDLQTSGVLLLSKSRAVNEAIASAFRDARVSKRYIAIVQHSSALAESFEVRKPIAAVRGSKPQRFSCVKSGGKASLTYFRVLGSFEFEGVILSCLEARPVTGRTHQIRVHLESLGLSILGDNLYGQQLISRKIRVHVPKRMCLHAQSLEIAHPKTFLLHEFLAPIPEVFLKFLKLCQKLSLRATMLEELKVLIK